MLHLVTAIIRPSRVDDVREVLEGRGITVSEIHGLGRQAGHVETYRGSEYRVDLVPKVRVEMLVDAGDVDLVMDALAAATRTGKVGDGKIWLSPVEAVVRVRTGEQGVEAI